VRVCVSVRLCVSLFVCVRAQACVFVRVQCAVYTSTCGVRAYVGVCESVCV